MMAADTILNPRVRERIEELVEKLDSGGLTTSEQFELAALVREAMGEVDEAVALLRERLEGRRPSGWGYPR